MAGTTRRASGSPDIVTILEEVRPIREAVGNNSTTLALIKKDIDDTIIPVLEKMSDTLYGNGDVGLVERVEEIEHLHKSQDDERKERAEARKAERDAFRKYRWALLLAASTSIMTLIFEIWVH